MTATYTFDVFTSLDCSPTAPMSPRCATPGSPPSDVVAVWGAGPVGQFAMDSARVLGAAKVIAIDKEPYRLRMAEQAGHTPVNFDEVNVRSTLLELTGGRGPDKCIDAVGLEADHGSAHLAAYDRVKQAVRSETDRARPAPGDPVVPQRHGEIDPTGIITHTLPWTRPNTATTSSRTSRTTAKRSSSNHDGRPGGTATAAPFTSCAACRPLGG
jgi:NADPH:quinone reductase-like Zn-dependent oxidoreductase